MNVACQFVNEYMFTMNLVISIYISRLVTPFTDIIIICHCSVKFEIFYVTDNMYAIVDFIYFRDSLYIHMYRSTLAIGSFNVKRKTLFPYFVFHTFSWVLQ